MVQKVVGNLIQTSNGASLLKQGMLVGCLGSEYDPSRVSEPNKLVIKNNRGVVVSPPSSTQHGNTRDKRKKSRVYTRPIFKEPGSKIPLIQPPSTKDVNKRQPLDDLRRDVRHQQRQQDPPASRRSDVVEDILKEANLATDRYGTVHDEVIQPSPNTNERLNRIMGRPSASNIQPSQTIPSKHTTSLARDRERSMRLEQRRCPSTGFVPSAQSRCRNYGYGLPSKSHDFRDDQTECGESVATVSNLDYLASKSLRRKKSSSSQLGEMHVSVLRQEIKEMVVCLEERASEQGRSVDKVEKVDEKGNSDKESKSNGEGHNSPSQYHALQQAAQAAFVDLLDNSLSICRCSQYGFR
jgi:hypothetical protein